MSFLNSPKTAGNAFEIIGILQIMGGIFAIIDGIRDEEVDIGFAAVIGISAIVCGSILAFYGWKVRSGEISEKIDILAIFVRISGIITIISGLFLVIAEAMIGADVLTEAISAIITIVIGLIIIFISTKINDGKQTTGDKIIWVLLLVFFILDVIGSILTIVGGFDPFRLSTIVTGICYTIAYIFMILLLFDSDVKKEMGM